MSFLLHYRIVSLWTVFHNDLYLHVYLELLLARSPRSFLRRFRGTRFGVSGVPCETRRGEPLRESPPVPESLRDESPPVPELRESQFTVSELLCKNDTLI